jgi:peptide-methionine (S)-S-oxide reductase
MSNRIFTAVRGLFGAAMSSPVQPIALPSETRKAVFGLGCFWAPDGQFPGQNGVLRTAVGYAGGVQADPTYRSIKDHTEVIEIEYDPTQITYDKLLTLFAEFHDPTQRIGSRQYISLLLFGDSAEEAAIKSWRETYEKTSKRPIATVVQKFDKFYEAERYHQKYHLQNDTRIMSAFGLTPADLVGSVLAAKLSAFVMGFASCETKQFIKENTKLTESQEGILDDLLARSGTGASCHI